jgi:hypothetical protein
MSMKFLQSFYEVYPKLLYDRLYEASMTFLQSLYAFLDSSYQFYEVTMKRLLSLSEAAMTFLRSFYNVSAKLL